MNMPIADVLDQLSIVLLKRYAGNVRNLESEICKLTKSIVEIAGSLNLPPQSHWLIRLQIWNSMIWANEAAIRDAKKCKKLSLEEVGRRALAIRKYNKERMKVKTEIAKWAGEQVDKKKDHASE